MANLIEGTVVNVGGNPLSVALSQTFPTGLIYMSSATVASSPTAATLIKYMYGPFSNQEYYVSDTIGDLLTAANDGTTSMVEVTVYEINGYPQNSPVSYAFPSNAIVLQSVSNGDINCIVSFGNKSYSVSETESEIVTAANVYNGGGGGSYWNVTGTTTLTGDAEIALDSHGLNFTDANTNIGITDGTFNAMAGDGTTYGQITAETSDVKLFYSAGGGDGSQIIMTSDIVASFGGTGTLKYASDPSSNLVGLSVPTVGYVNSAKYNVQTGTSYSLQDSDNGKVVTLNNGSAITLTVPAGLSAGFNCSIVQLGAGQVTITPSSTTVHNRQSYTKLAGQYAMATLLMYDTDIFVSQGDMTT